MSGAPHGIMDLNLAAQNLHTRKRRVYDITNCLEGIKLIQKQSANKIKWMWVVYLQHTGSLPVCAPTFCVYVSVLTGCVHAGLYSLGTEWNKTD